MPWNCTKLPTVTGKVPPECTLEADGCMCSRGCQSTYACSPSALCSRPDARPSGAALKVPIVLFLQFNESLVRHKYATHPTTAYRREFNRILWFVESARRVQTRMPLYVAVGGRRNHSAEAHLQRLGVGIVSLPFVAPPSWSSLFHHFSFSRIAALSLTQFEKVRVRVRDRVRARVRVTLTLALTLTLTSLRVEQDGHVLAARARGGGLGELAVVVEAQCRAAPGGGAW